MELNLTKEVLIESGFKEHVYESQDGKPLFYRKDFKMYGDSEFITHYLGDSWLEPDVCYNVVVEFPEDLSFVQFYIEESGDFEIFDVKQYPNDAHLLLGMVGVNV
jgi:hypothetical protein